MAHWAKAANEKIESISALISGMLATDEQDYSTLFTDMQNLEGDIKSSPTERREAYEALVDTKHKIELAEQKLDDIEANLLLNIYAEIDGATGKPVYTNERQRDAALQIAKRESDEYQEVWDECQVLYFERTAREARLRELDEKDKAHRLLYGGMIARLENLTARISINGKGE